MARAAARVVAIQGRYATARVSLAQAALAGAAKCEVLRHYPGNDVIDLDNRSQFYYHAHPSRRYPANEHGHFHLFVRDFEGAGFSHLAALSLDATGWPLRWFTTNRWVTGERWVDAETAIAAIQDFRPRTYGRLAPIAQWLGGMTALYGDVLSRLIRRRDAIVAKRIASGSVEAVFEDRRLDVVTEANISLPQRLSQVTGRGRG